MKLCEMKELRVVSRSVCEVPYDLVRNYSEVDSISNVYSVTDHCVLRNAEWYGEDRESGAVYSGLNNVVLLSKKENGTITLVLYELVNQRLSEKERKKLIMENLDAMLAGDVLAEDMFSEEIENININDLDQSTGFEDMKEMDVFKEEERQDRVESEEREDRGSIGRQIRKANKGLTRAVRQLCSLDFFITKTDAVCVPSKNKIPVLVDKKPVLLDTHKNDKELIKKINEGKKVPLSKVKTEFEITFKEKAPGSVVGVAMSLPTFCVGNSDVMAKVLGSEVVDFDKNNTDTTHIVAQQEYAFALIASLFDGVIRENSDVVGEGADEIQILASRTPNGKIRHRFKPINRKSLLNDFNYLPIAVHAVANQQSIDDEQRVLLNNTLSSVIKDENFFNLLCDESKAIIKYDPGADTTCDAEWFKNGTNHLINVRPFWGSKEDIPFRESPMFMLKQKVEKKSKPGEYTYRIVKHDATSDDGVFSNKKYTNMIEKIGMTKEDMLAQFATLTSRKSKKDEARELAIQETVEDLVSGLVAANEGTQEGLPGHELEDFLANII